MAITFALVSRGANHAVYLATSTGDRTTDLGLLQCVGAGAADVSLQDAAVPGLLKQIVDLDNIADQHHARRQLLDWGLAPFAGDGILNVPGSRLRAYFVDVVPDQGAQEVDKQWSVDALTDGFPGTHGDYFVSTVGAGASRAMLVIEAIGTPQQF